MMLSDAMQSSSLREEAKNRSLMRVLFSIFCLTLFGSVDGQQYVEVETSIPGNDANNAQGLKAGVWRNHVMAPTTADNFPSDQNWWSILQTQFYDSRYDAQLAFGLNNEDLWLRFNYNDNWHAWKKVLLEDSDGNIAIGADSPALGYKLHVAGSLLSRSSYASELRLQSLAGGTSVVSDWEILTGHSSLGNVQNLGFWSSGSAKVVFTAQGNVGIGKLDPSHKLDVKGSIRAEEIIVEVGTADYVFEDGYELRSLGDVEAHILEHGHLPGVPSAAEVAEQGVSVGDSQRILLEKVEELTLYTIEQEAKILSQAAELQERALLIDGLEARLQKIERALSQ